MTTTLTATPTQAAPRSLWSGRATVALFTATAFIGAALLFTIQPMVARLLLPLYGGSATVWSTSSLFFQVLLLAGYIYSHVTTSRIPRRGQPLVHLLVLLLPLAVLPLALPATAAPPADGSPAIWLLRTLALMVGLPFVVLATSGPLLQRWYSWAGGPRSDDPYFLFAASNVGSFGGLLAYPFLIEPHLTLARQSTLFSWGFMGFAVLTAACGLLGTRSSATTTRTASRPLPRIPAPRLARWGWYAFVPSCLFLAVTRHLSTDVAPIPLLWVVPLALYLATFVVAFAVTGRTVSSTFLRLTTGAAVGALLLTLLLPGLPLGFSVGVDLILVVVVGLAAHRLLAADRPDPSHLTTYYIVVAVGGALGGLVNGLLAPVAFDRVLEYPLILALVPTLAAANVSAWAQAGKRSHRPPLLVVSFASIIGGTAALIWVVRRESDFGEFVVLLVLVGLGYVVSAAPRLLAVLLVAGVVATTAIDDASIVRRERTFYGTYAVHESDLTRTFSHGTTIHGLQQLDAPHVPTTYYARQAPLGDLMRAVSPRRTVVVGLGVGTIAAYGRPNDEMTFFEIDPAVAAIAEDPELFTFLADSQAHVDVVTGDGRLLSERLSPGTVDALVLDAFSSDSIPAHLLTREAFRTYARATGQRGVVAVHISNRHFDLAPVVASATRDLGWSGVMGVGADRGAAAASTWIVITADPEIPRRLLQDPRWESLNLTNRVAWTDDYSSVLTVLR